MTFCGNYSVEKLVVHPNDAPHESHYIDITMDKNEPIFHVSCCCDEEWSWTFMYSNTVYEIVKYYIMDCINECDTMDELIDAIDAIFEEDCMDFVFDEDNCVFADCDGNCDDCDCCGCEE